jgi:hypothetical protein
MLSFELHRSRHASAQCVVFCTPYSAAGWIRPLYFPEEIGLIEKHKAMFTFGSMTLLVGGLALASLLVYGWLSGHELPLWPAILVALVNIAGALKLVQETRARRGMQQRDQSVAQSDQGNRRRK